MTLLGVLFVTFSGVIRDLHLGYQKVTWKLLASFYFYEEFLLLNPLKTKMAVPMPGCKRKAPMVVFWECFVPPQNSG